MRLLTSIEPRLAYFPFTPGRSAAKLTGMPKRFSPQIDISMADRSIRVSRKEIEELVCFVVAAEGRTVGHVDVAIVSSDDIAEHNRRFLLHRGPTDVISFDLSDASIPGVSAQIIASAQVAKRQAPTHGTKPKDELLLYVVHGLLHVMGYDDTAVRAAARMSARQDELLRAFAKRHKASSKQPTANPKEAASSRRPAPKPRKTT